jgi:hypothetical protein
MANYSLFYSLNGDYLGEVLRSLAIVFRSLAIVFRSLAKKRAIYLGEKAKV